MVFSGHVLSDSRFHETGKRRQHVDRWINVSVVKLTINVNLTLGNVTSQIRDRMGDIYREKKG